MTIVRAIILIAFVAAAVPARSAEPIIGVTTPAADGASLFVGEEEGFYAKHGLEVTIQLAALMPNTPPMLASGSARFGLLTPATVIQAVDGGLDLVAISGASVLTRALSVQTVVAREGTGIKTAADLAGKRVGVPGFGASLHVEMLYWLEKNGVDAKAVKFVEVSFPAMRDLLASNQVDAVIAIDPILSQILSSKTGYMVADLVQDMPEGSAALIVAGMRDWVVAHDAETKALQAALAEAEAFVNANPDKTRADVAVYIKMPPELLKLARISHQEPVVTPEQLQWWIDVMKRNQMLTGSVDAAKIIVPR